MLISRGLLTFKVLARMLAPHQTPSLSSQSNGFLLLSHITRLFNYYLFPVFLPPQKNNQS